MILWSDNNGKKIQLTETGKCLLIVHVSEKCIEPYSP